MADTAGKICPCCRNEFLIGEEIVRCPDCLTPVHKKCREQNFACPVCGSLKPFRIVPPENDAVSCAVCGARIEGDQSFCPMCGSPKQPPPRRCGNCSADVGEGFLFCPGCGQRIAPAAVQSFPSAIDQYNMGVLKKKKRFLPFVLAAIVLVVVLGGYFTYSAVQKNIGTANQKESAAETASRIAADEQAAIAADKAAADKAAADKAVADQTAAAERTDYINKVNDYIQYMYDDSKKLEDIDNEIIQEWYDSVYNDPNQTTSIDQAIANAQSKESDNMDTVENDKASIDDLYQQIIAAQFSDEQLSEIFDDVATVNDAYNDLYNSAVSPNGNYKSYLADANAKDDSFIAKYNVLVDLYNKSRG